MAILPALLLAASVPSACSSAYLFVLTVLSKAPSPPPAAAIPPRFRIIVPAHDEEGGIEGTVKNLLELDYPKDRFEVVVVADNCKDATAARARAAGATVLERNDRALRGKGYALHHAFERLPEDVDAAVVIDADTIVSPNLLSAFAARLAAGAEVVQADYAVRNANAAWRTRLMAVAFGAFHVVRSRGRERLGVSCGLRGNGMCFSRRVLQLVPHEAFSIVEDVEYGIRLGLSGHRVHYADEAHVYGEMVASARTAESQRERWEGGRKALVKAHALNLLREAAFRRSKVLLDLGLDVLTPPLSTLVVLGVSGLAASTVVGLAQGAVPVAAFVFAGSLAGLGVYVARGWSVSGTGARGLVDLALAPAYVAWKLTLKFKKPEKPAAEWVRTARSGESTEPRAR